MSTSSPSVLIIRLDAIGDALALAPLVAALRAQHVPTDIVLTRANAGAFAAGTFGRVYIAPFDLRDDSAQNREAIEVFGHELRERRYTHALVATEDLSGYRLAQQTRAPRRIGFHNAWGKPLKTLMVRRMLTRTVFRTAGLDSSAPHECEVLYRLGDGLTSAEPTRDAAQLRPLVTSFSDGGGGTALQVTDKFARLSIPDEEVRALVEGLRARGPLRLFSSAREAPYARRIAGDADVAVFDSVDAWKAAIAGADAYVAPDSGGIHVAGMCGVATIALFAPQAHFDLQVARWHPWAAPYRIVETAAEWPQRAMLALQALQAR